MTKIEALVFEKLKQNKYLSDEGAKYFTAVLIDCLNEVLSEPPTVSPKEEEAKPPEFAFSHPSSDEIPSEQQHGKGMGFS